MPKKSMLPVFFDTSFDTAYNNKSKFIDFFLSTYFMLPVSYAHFCNFYNVCLWAYVYMVSQYR